MVSAIIRPMGDGVSKVTVRFRDHEVSVFSREPYKAVDYIVRVHAPLCAN